MFLFPVTYIAAFLYGLLQLIRKQIEGLLIFTIIGLPIYINALSVTFMYGFSGLIPVMQSFKEIIVLASCYLVAIGIKSKSRLHRIDILMIIFFAYTVLYALLPIGSYSIISRFLALKTLSFFPLLYFIGRFCKVDSINLKKFFSYICIVIIIAALVAFLEKITNQHLHSFTGFSEFNYYFFGAEESGNYGLLWTFETESGAKRFGSIFSNPLDLASATVLSLSIILSLITYKRKKIVIRTSNFELISLAATFFCILFAASRASFAGYFMLIYVYGWITKNRNIIRTFHTFFISVTIYIIFFLEGDLFDFIVNTIKFQNASSLGHVLEWLDGINAMIAHPLGLGLGESGRVSMAVQQNTGGENQLIIIGVQAGVLAMLLYLTIYVAFIRTGLRELKKAGGKKWKLILAVVLIKISLIIPTFTAYIDSYIYLSYLSWFLSGYMINMIMAPSTSPLVVPKLQNDLSPAL
jgi:hypothetical protein